MEPAAATKTGVALVLMNGRSHNALQMLIETRASDAYRIADVGQARIVIADLDSAESVEGWGTFRQQHPHLHVIGMAFGNKVPDDVTRVGKPVRASELLAALATVSTTLVSAQTASPAGSVRDAPRKVHAISQVMGRRLGVFEGKAESADPQDETFDPTRLYVSLVERTLREVLADGRARTIQGDLQFGKPLLLSAERGGSVIEMLPDVILRRLCATPVDTHPLSVELADDRAQGLASLTATSADAFLWKMAAWTSNGRRPIDISDDSVVRLRRWPNLPRLLPIGSGMRIAALWVRGAHSLSDTARLLGIELSTVRTFCYAAHVIGLLEVVAVAAPPTRATVVNGVAGQANGASVPADQAQHRGLFARIIKHLLG